MLARPDSADTIKLALLELAVVKFPVTELPSNELLPVAHLLCLQRPFGKNLPLAPVSMVRNPLNSGSFVPFLIYIVFDKHKKHGKPNQTSHNYARIPSA
jgi:hypothetical protein